MHATTRSLVTAHPVAGAPFRSAAALARVYLQRVRRALVVVTLTVAPLCVLFARKSGYQPADMLLNLTVLAALYPLAVGGVVTKSKADGSLAFLSSLPIAPHDHATAWFIVVAMLCLPFSVAAGMVASLTPLALPGTAPVLVAVSTFGYMVSLVFTMLATQLSAPPATAGSHFIGVVSVLLMFIAGVGKLRDTWPELFLRVVSSPAFLSALSVVLWLVAVLAFWRAWRRIGFFMTSYVGDPPRA